MSQHITVPPELTRPAASLPEQVSSLSHRFIFLDGLRGLAALYVVLFHIIVQFDPGSPLQTHLPLLVHLTTGWMRYGIWAVDLFIVLSGYCLMLPVVHSTTGQLRGGVRRYIARRATRILPPYYAALILAFVPLIASQLMPSVAGAQSASWKFNFSAVAILSHVFLVHNWRVDTLGLYDGPMWTVAAEWQIYFIFPLLLLVRRRFNTLAATAVALVVGLLPHFLLPAGKNFDWAGPWFLGLFGLGMLGAQITLSSAPGAALWRQNAPWGTLAVLLLVIDVVLESLGWEMHDSWLLNTIAGTAGVCVILFCARHVSAAEGARAPIILRLFTSRWAIRLGTFSYSLYLMHLLVVIYYLRLLQRFHIGFLSTPVAVYCICLPAALIASYLFYLAVERRFLPGHLRTESRDAIAVLVSPAP